MPNQTLHEKFMRYIADNGLVEPGQRVLLAVSGGVDSMVMMDLFAKGGFDTGVAHCNFCLRGSESDEDEVTVARKAAEYGMPCYNKRFDTEGEMDRTGESVQMAARRLRYTWFDELCREHNYQVIAIAHHADDSIETFFINLLRGTGLRGLIGISASYGRVVRPLLFATRHIIMDYAQAHKIEFREDSSNRSTKYLRNKIRLGLIPRILEINPRFSEQMSENIHRLTEAQVFINRSIERIAADIVEYRDGIKMVDPGKIDAGLPLEFVIFELLKVDGFRGDVIHNLIDALHHDQTGKRFYSKEMVAYIDRGRIAVCPISEQDECNIELAQGSRKAYCGNRMLHFESLDIDDLESLNVPKNIALLDADKLEYPLHLRRWKEGDYFIPLGMNGHKKVSDFLTDEKVSPAQKTRQFVLTSGTDIVWLVDQRIDDRYSITPTTENVLKIVAEIL